MAQVLSADSSAKDAWFAFADAADSSKSKGEFRVGSRPKILRYDIAVEPITAVPDRQTAIYQGLKDLRFGTGEIDLAFVPTVEIVASETAPEVLAKVIALPAQLLDTVIAPVFPTGKHLRSV